MINVRFREFLQKDLKTFINQDEFGVEVIFEGEPVLVVLDDDKMIERQLAKSIEGELHTEELLFYVEKYEISFYPRPDNIVQYDGVTWRVESIQEDEGLFTVTCERVSA